MVREDLLVEENRQLTTIHYHERYRRTVVKHIGRHGEQERNARKLKEQTRSKHLPPLPVTPRLTNIYSDEIRLSAIHALRKCHTQWEGTWWWCLFLGVSALLIHGAMPSHFWFCFQSLFCFQERIIPPKLTLCAPTTNPTHRSGVPPLN
jgi:hypothetical protein